MHYENIKKENTRLAGKIGLFLLEQLSDEKDLQYTERDKQLNKLQGVLLNSAWMIKVELISIFQIVLDRIKGQEEDVLSAVKNGNPNVLRMYSDLAKRSVSDIYHCGQAPFAVLEMTMRLKESMWISHNEAPTYHSVEMDSYFEFNSHLSNEYYPVSAYKTPIINMLQVSQKSVTDFIIDLCNKTGEAYLKSQLNEDYEECTKVMIYVDGQEIEQTICVW